MSSFMEFLGHRKYDGITVMQAFNPVHIAGPTHTRRVKGNPRHITTVDKYQSYISQYNKKAQVYVGLNPVKPGLKGFPTDKDVLVWCNELLDLDLEKPKLIDDAVPDGYPKEYKHYAAKKSDLEKLEPFINKINEWLTDHGFKTGYQDHTGNGYRWILPIPGLDLTGHDLKALAAKKKEFKERIARECGITGGCGVHLDHVFDFRRITGVPGTLNFKLETTTRKNRMREPFKGTERDEDAALRDHILDIELPKETTHAANEGGAPKSLEHLMIGDDKLKRLYDGDTTGYESRSEAEYALCCKAAGYNFTESETENILLSAGIGKAAEEKRSGHDTYITRTVSKAFSAQTERISTEAAQTAKAPIADMSSTDRLIELGKQDTVFFHTPEDTCYAAVKLETGGSAILPVATKGRFAKILRQRYYIATGKAPQPDVLKNAVNTLEAAAMNNGNISTLHVRVAERNGNIYYDLTNTNYEAIEITPHGWGVMAHGHILFRRYSHQIPQVDPVQGGDVWKLFDFMNVPEPDRLLVMVYLISCFVPGIAHVIPIITGEHGTAKTTASKLFKLLVDPSVLDVISLPVNEDRFHQMLSHHWFVVFDNIDWIQRWQSDALCRASTGQATALRALYTNEDDLIFKYRMCVGLNGINNAATKPDLLSRAIFLNLDPIPDNQRMHETELMNRFNAARSWILGGIFDVLSKALSIYPTIHLDILPRMADFALWGCAISEALGHTKEELLDAYYANISQVNRAALEASPIGVAIMSLMENQTEWEGSPSHLLRELDLLAGGLYIDTKSKSWAKSPDSLGKRMKTVIPNLRKMGIDVERGKSGDRNYRIYRSSSLKEVSNVSNVSNANEKPHNPTCPTCPEVSKESGHFDQTCPDSGHLNSDQKRQQANTLGHFDALDTSAPISSGDGV